MVKQQISWQQGAILRRVRVSRADVCVFFFCVFFFYYPGQLPVQTLLRCLYNPSVQWHASTSLRTLKIPNKGSHTIVWTHEITAHTLVGMGSAALAAAVRYPEISRKEQRKC